MAWDGIGSPVSAGSPSSGASTADLILRVHDLVAETGLDSYDGDGNDAEILAAIVDGVVTLFSQVDALPTELAANTVIGESDVAPTARVARFTSLYAAGRRLDAIYAVEVPERSFTATGAPTHFCAEFLSGTGDPVLRLYPTPDSVVALTGIYYRIPPTLSLAAGSLPAVDPLWHSEFHFAPCYYAASLLLTKDNRAQSANLMLGRFFAEIDRYQKWMNKRTTGSKTLNVPTNPLGSTFAIDR